MLRDSQTSALAAPTRIFLAARCRPSRALHEGTNPSRRYLCDRHHSVSWRSRVARAVGTVALRGNGESARGGGLSLGYLQNAESLAARLVDAPLPLISPGEPPWPLNRVLATVRNQVADGAFASISHDLRTPLLAQSGDRRHRARLIDCARYCARVWRADFARQFVPRFAQTDRQRSLAKGSRRLGLERGRRSPGTRRGATECHRRVPGSKVQQMQEIQFSCGISL
jgi:hypothetical protein